MSFAFFFICPGTLLLFFFSFAHPIFCLRTFLYLSPSLDVRDSDPGGTERVPRAPPHYGTRLHFCQRELFSAFLSRRLASNCAYTDLELLWIGFVE